MLDDYDFSLGITQEGQLTGFIRDGYGHSFDLAERAVGWYRKPDFEQMQVRAKAEFSELVKSEAASFIDAICALPNIHWINKPPAVVAARSKPAQLLLAHELGFSVPNTIITNDPDAAVSFAQSLDHGIVAKTVYSASVQFDGHDFACITKRIDLDTLQRNKDSIGLCPTQLQEEIGKLCDIRITVVDDKAFACRIESQGHEVTQVDWRVDPDLCRYGELDLPDWVRDACCRLVRDSGLEYGAIDLVYSKDEKYYFLENNPGGQYLWIEIDTGLPITDALIDLFEKRMSQPAT